jgi:hypothetical protein
MKIAKKLAEFQKLSQKVVRDSKNPHYRSKYASLDAVLDCIQAPLLESGLTAIQRIDEDFLIFNGGDNVFFGLFKDFTLNEFSVPIGHFKMSVVFSAVRKVIRNEKS